MQYLLVGGVIVQLQHEAHARGQLHVAAHSLGYSSVSTTGFAYYQVCSLLGLQYLVVGGCIVHLQHEAHARGQIHVAAHSLIYSSVSTTKFVY